MKNPIWWENPPEDPPEPRHEEPELSHDEWELIDQNDLNVMSEYEKLI